ncbi:MAG: hypothetical protein KF847_17420 [Pirellulales bacterium]|nr:hypothetical protein [Pirellulales bacterium]
MKTTFRFDRLTKLPRVCASATLVLVGAATFASAGYGAVFSFGNDANGLNGFPGPASIALSSGEFSMELTAGPAGAVLRETNGAAGLGVDSAAIPDVTDVLAFSMSLLGGTGPLAGSAEYVEFSFDRPGRITGLDFDGLSDERLEYFRLETIGGVRYNFFDSAADTTVPGAVQGAIDAGVLPGETIFLLEILGGPIDEAQGLSIPFAAGQTFRLTYGELGAAFGALRAGNGGTLQGITVEPVSEPAAALLALTAAIGPWRLRPAGNRGGVRSQAPLG